MGNKCPFLKWFNKLCGNYSNSRNKKIITKRLLKIPSFVLVIDMGKIDTRNC